MVRTFPISMPFSPPSHHPCSQVPGQSGRPYCACSFLSYRQKKTPSGRKIAFLFLGSPAFASGRREQKKPMLRSDSTPPLFFRAEHQSRADRQRPQHPAAAMEHHGTAQPPRLGSRARFGWPLASSGHFLDPFSETRRRSAHGALPGRVVLVPAAIRFLSLAVRNK